MRPVELSDPRRPWAAVLDRPLAGVDGSQVESVAMIMLIPLGADSDRVLGARNSLGSRLPPRPAS